MVVAVLAVLKAGGAYVPLDPAYPPSAWRFMLEDSAPLLVLTTKRRSARALAGGRRAGGSDRRGRATRSSAAGDEPGRGRSRPETWPT